MYIHKTEQDLQKNYSITQKTIFRVQYHSADFSSNENEYLVIFYNFHSYHIKIAYFI